MNDTTMKAAIAAQFLMGHQPANSHMARDNKTIVDWSWNVDYVRQQLHVPLNALWHERVRALEAQGLASFCFFAAPVTYDEQGNAHEMPGWRDVPREEWGSACMHARGVLALATRSGRPFVRREASRALVAQWQLVQAAREARLRALDTQEAL